MTKPKKTETRLQRQRSKRRAAGLCGREGCPKITGKRYYCPEHELHVYTPLGNVE